MAKKKKTSLLDKFRRWLRDGNDCERCLCCWLEQGLEDFAGGCYAGMDYVAGVCRIPKIARWYIYRRAMFAQDHKYDGIAEWFEEDERQQEIAEQAMCKRHSSLVLCFEMEQPDGSAVLLPYIQDTVKREICYDIRCALDDDRGKRAPRKLRDKWDALFKETMKHIVFKFRAILTI